jgi:hypothetical protein
VSVPYSSQSAECVKWEIRTFAFRSRVITASSWIATYCATSANAPVLYAFWMDSLCFCTAVSSLAMDRSADSASAFVRSCVYGNRKGQSICWACIGRVLDDGLVSNREGNRSEQSPAKGPNSHRRVRGKTGGVSDLGKPRPAVPESPSSPAPRQGLVVVWRESLQETRITNRCLFSSRRTPL